MTRLGFNSNIVK